ncbi:MAG: hypothetical protein P8Y94_11275 [Acidobacteriota bacterium]
MRIRTGLGVFVTCICLSAAVAPAAAQGTLIITSSQFIGFEHMSNDSKVEKANYEFGVESFLNKKVFLDAASEIGRLTRSPSVAPLEQTWEKVQSEYQKLMKEAGD